MRRWAMVIFCLLLLCACGKTPGDVPEETPELSWQEQFELGQRYLSEGKYQEAIIAFQALIEIDPKQAQVYAALADAYYGAGDQDKALAILQQGFEATSDTTLQERIEQIQAELAALEQELLKQKLQEELWPSVRGLELPLTIGEVTLGKTTIQEAKDLYSGYPYAISNLMTNETEDTVYTCFGMNGMPVPEGHYENQFGFLFAGPAQGGPVHYMIACDAEIECLGGLRPDDDMATALTLFGLPAEAPEVSLEWTLDNGARLSYTYGGTDWSTIQYCPEGFGKDAGVVVNIDYGQVNSIEIDGQAKEGGPVSLGCTLDGTLEITGLACVFEPDSNIKQQNENAVAGLRLEFDVQGPAEVKDVRIASWEKASQEINVQQQMELMRDVWKNDPIQGEAVPFMRDQSMPLYAEDLGTSMQILLLGLDEQGNIPAYAIVGVTIPE